MQYDTTSNQTTIVLIFIYVFTGDISFKGQSLGDKKIKISVNVFFVSFTLVLQDIFFNCKVLHSPQLYN